MDVLASGWWRYNGSGKSLFQMQAAIITRTGVSITMPRSESADSVLSCCNGRRSNTLLENDLGIRPGSGSR